MADECAPENWQRQSAFTSFRRDRPRSPAVLAPVAAGLRLNQTKEARRNAPIRKQNFRFSPLSAKNTGE